jgi:hypothetical protein
MANDESARRSVHDIHTVPSGAAASDGVFVTSGAGVSIDTGVGGEAGVASLAVQAAYSDAAPSDAAHPLRSRRTR